MNIQSINIVNFKGQNRTIINFQPSFNYIDFTKITKKSNLSFNGSDLFLKNKDKETENTIREIEKLAKSTKQELTQEEIKQIKKCLEANFTDKNAILKQGAKLKDKEIEQAKKCLDKGLKIEWYILKYGSKLTDDEINEVKKLVDNDIMNENFAFEKVASNKQKNIDTLNKYGISAGIIKHENGYQTAIDKNSVVRYERFCDGNQKFYADNGQLLIDTQKGITFYKNGQKQMEYLGKDHIKWYDENGNLIAEDEGCLCTRYLGCKKIAFVIDKNSDRFKAVIYTKNDNVTDIDPDEFYLRLEEEPLPYTLKKDKSNFLSGKEEHFNLPNKFEHGAQLKLAKTKILIKVAGKIAEEME